MLIDYTSLYKNDRFIFKIPGFFFWEVQNLSTKPAETGDLVDYAEIPGFSGGIVQLLALFEKKPGIENIETGDLKVGLVSLVA